MFLLVSGDDSSDEFSFLEVLGSGARGNNMRQIPEHLQPETLFPNELFVGNSCFWVSTLFLANNWPRKRGGDVPIGAISADGTETTGKEKMNDCLAFKRQQSVLFPFLWSR